MTELTFKFKGDDNYEKLRHSKTITVEEIYTTSQDDPVIQKHLKEALSAITWQPDEIEYIIKGIIVQELAPNG